MKKIPQGNLKNKTIAIVTYEATTGPSHDLRDYLLERTKGLLFISHPLLYIPSSYSKSSYWELYRGKEKKSQGKAFHWILPEYLLYIKDVFYTIFWIVTKARKVDVFFGVGNINAFVGILLKKIGVVDQVIFYSIDFVPIRFSFPLLNNIYHFIDRTAVSSSDTTWNLSSRMSEGRKNKWKKELGNQITVPIGIWYERISKHRMQKINNHELIYLGTILEKQGIDICIRAVNELREEIKDITFTIIGSGPYENTIKSLIKELHLEKHVHMLGYLPSHEDVERRLSQASLAVALYNPEKDMFSYYADPGKVKSYLACGLPILITDIPQIAKELDKRKCGIVAEYKLEDIVKKMRAYFHDDKTINMYRNNAIIFGAEFDWPNVLKKAFRQSGYSHI